MKNKSQNKNIGVFPSSKKEEQFNEKNPPGVNSKTPSVFRLRYTLPTLFVVLLIFLKLPLLSIYIETVRLIITFTPMAAIAGVAFYAFYQTNQEEKPNRLKYYLLILKILLAILAFYILYAPGEFADFFKVFLSYIGSFLTLEGLIFLSGPISVVSFLLFVGLFAYRFFQSKQGTYRGSLSKLFRRLSFTLFFLFLALGSTIVMASPQTIKPMTDYLGDTIFTLSGGNIQVLKGTDVSQYKKILSLKEMTASLSSSLADTSENLSQVIKENETTFKEDLSQSSQELASSISETTKDLKDKLEEDIDDKLPLGGGTLSGKLTVGKNLTVQGETEFEDTVNADNLLPNANSSYNLGSADKKWNFLYLSGLFVSEIDLGTNTVSDGQFSGNWNFSGGNLSNIGTLSADSYNGLTLSSGSGSLDLGDYSLVLSGDANLNQSLLTSASPSFSGLTLSGDLALGSNTLATDNTALVSNLNADLLDGQHGSYYLPKANVSGTDNYLAKFNGTDALEDSVIYETNGNVGIGTTSPVAKLQVLGDILSNDLRFLDTQGYITYNLNSTNNGVGSGGSLKFRTGSGSEVMRLDSSGNVGIGTTSPANKLDVEGGVAIGATYSGTSAAPGNGMIIEGNVGIGTTAPGAKLEVNVGNIKVGSSITNGGTIYSIYGNNDLTGHAADNQAQSLIIRMEGGLTGGGYNEGAIRFFTGLNGATTEKVTIQQAGNVGIGTTSPGAKLDVNGNFRVGTNAGHRWIIDTAGEMYHYYSTEAQPRTMFDRDFGASSQDGWFFGSGISTIDASGVGIARSGTRKLGLFTSDGSTRQERVTIDGSGNVGIGTTAPGELLDVRGDGQFITNTHTHTTGTIAGTDAILRLYNNWESDTDEKGAILTFEDNYPTGGSYARTTRAAIKGGTDTTGNTADGFLAFYTDSEGANTAEERMRIDNNGNVGIGTTSPSQQLEITGNFEIPNTTYADQSGIIYKGSAPFIHNFNYGNNGTVTTTGNNTFVGVNAGNLTMGSTATQVWHSSYNSAMGAYALYFNTTGYQNSAMGMNALRSNTTGYQNSAMGVNALYSNTTGSNNSAMGMQALYANTTGYANTANGLNALRSNTTGYNNSAMGYQALYNVKPTGKAITAFADYSGTVAGTVKATSTAHGLTGTVANIRISGTTNYDGVYTITVIDADNFYFTDTWAGNDATGWWSKDTEGRYNTALGYAAGDNITTGSNNLIIGYNVDAPSATGDYQLNIGNAIYGDLSSGKIGIGTTSPNDKLEVVGNIRVTGGSFIDDGTTLSVPDYVFEDGYNLRTISELEIFINTNYHLPGVASRTEIKENGMNYGSMIMSILEKTEENTLYIIDNYHGIKNQELRIMNNELGIADLSTSVIPSLSKNLSDLSTSLEMTELSIEDKITIIGAELEDWESLLDSLIEKEEEKAQEIQTLSKTVAALNETDTRILEMLSDHETRISRLETAISDSDPSTMFGMADIVISTEVEKFLLQWGIKRISPETGEYLFDLDGNLKVNKLEAETVVAGEVKIKEGDEAEKISGSGIIFIGNKQTEIATKNFGENAKIFYSFNKNPSAFSWIEKTKNEISGEFNGFILKLSQQASEDLTFDWWILEVE